MIVLKKFITNTYVLNTAVISTEHNFQCKKTASVVCVLYRHAKHIRPYLSVTHISRIWFLHCFSNNVYTITGLLLPKIRLKMIKHTHSLYIPFSLPVSPSPGFPPPTAPDAPFSLTGPSLSSSLSAFTQNEQSTNGSYIFRA